MVDWQNEWTKVIESMATDVEQFFQDVSQEVGDMAETLIELSEGMVEELEHTISPGLDQFDEQLTQWLEPILQALTGLEGTLDRAVEPVTHTVEPWLNQHPICMGCRHYHGQVYGDSMLVCAMHPYGITDGAESCPDKELIVWSFHSSSSADDEQ